MILWQLFWSFLQVGLFSVGGGYAALPFIQQQLVDLHGWLTVSEFADVVAISQMTPGPIAINAATFVGLRVGGVAGAVVATLGFVLPSMVVVLTLAWVYYRYRSLTFLQGVLYGMRPAVVALIASAGLSMAVSTLWKGQPVSLDPSRLDVPFIAIAIGAFVALRLPKKPDPILVMAAAGAAGVALYAIVSSIGTVTS